MYGSCDDGGHNDQDGNRISDEHGGSYDHHSKGDSDGDGGYEVMILISLVSFYDNDNSYQDGYSSENGNCDAHVPVMMVDIGSHYDEYTNDGKNNHDNTRYGGGNEGNVGSDNSCE